MSQENEEKLLQLSDEFQIGKGLNPDEHIKLLRQIEQFPKDEAIEALNFFLSRETSPQVMLHIIKTLGKYNDKSSTSVLTDILLWKNTSQQTVEQLDEYLKVRCMAAALIGNLKDYNSVVPLLYVLNNKDENYKLRLSVAEALGRIGDKYAVIPLIEVVTDESEKSVYLRESAAKALGMLGDLRAIDPLVKILETKKGLIDKFTFLKERAIEAIGRLGFRDDRTLKVLNNTLLDESPSIRLGAIEALSEIDDEKVIPLIEKMIGDNEEDVARGAINALYDICGSDYLINLLKNNDLPAWCREEIEIILEDEESEE